MDQLDRRDVLSTLVCAAACVALPSGGKDVLTDRMEIAREAVERWRAAFDLWKTCRNSYEVVEIATSEGVREEFIPTAPTLLYDEVRDRAQAAVEAVLMTPPENDSDDAAIMDALDLYAEIAPSAFALMTARDLFTPRRYQTYPLAQIRHWLLTDPEEDFEKTGMPAFLKTMRQRVRKV